MNSITLEGGKTLKTDIVILDAEAKASTGLAKDAGLRIIDKGFIWVSASTDTLLYAGGMNRRIHGSK